MDTSIDDNERSQPKASLRSHGSGLSVPTTPLRHSSAGSSQQSSHHSTSVSQKELQDTLQSELSGATFESDALSLGDALSDETIHEIKTRLPTWPSEGREQAYYEPVVKTISVVRDVLRKRRKPDEPRGIYDDHGLFLYADCAMMDSVDGAHAVKSDLILARRKELGENERVRWRDVDMVVEVKRDWPDLVTQAATYARALLYSNSTRWFSLVIGVNHKMRQARFMFFHQGGLTSTRELTMDGDAPEFPKFAQMLETVFSCKNPMDAGFFPAPSRDGPFEDVSLLSSRTCIRGRANQVAVLSQKDNTGPRHAEALSYPPARRSAHLAEKSTRQVQAQPTPPPKLPRGNQSHARGPATKDITMPRDEARIVT
ncbi:hypothetical protein BS47DRAFT_164189 [Hydnum rufescens UP504]|uniref:Fungal-type protein kinase domain-containing protein n=1 Tax=Hydnum rufescens UP504 TaxID=1448309 RepID=A0A9P6DYW1_9AGAM|nr:hypothetical protein BS47DRAFT_164189 [Hydnum rufescens UP504]